MQRSGIREKTSEHKKKPRITASPSFGLLALSVVLSLKGLVAHWFVITKLVLGTEYTKPSHFMLVIEGEISVGGSWVCDFLSFCT